MLRMNDRTDSVHALSHSIKKIWLQLPVAKIKLLFPIAFEHSFLAYQRFVLGFQCFSTFSSFISRLQDRYTKLNSLAEFTSVEKFTKLATLPDYKTF